MAAEPLLFFRFLVLRVVEPPRLVDAFFAVFALRLVGFERMDFRLVPLRDDLSSVESASPPITRPAVVPCDAEKLNSMFCLRVSGAFLVPRRLLGPAFGVDVFEVVPFDVICLDTPFLAVRGRWLPERWLPACWELRLPRLRLVVSWAAVSVAVQSFSTSCDETTR